MIAATGLCKSFGDKVVLDGIDLDIAEESIFSLLGPNGAGKDHGRSLCRCRAMAVSGRCVRCSTGWTPRRSRSMRNPTTLFGSLLVPIILILMFGTFRPVPAAVDMSAYLTGMS